MYGAPFVLKLVKIAVFKWQLQVYKHCYRFDPYTVLCDKYLPDKLE